MPKEFVDSRYLKEGFESEVIKVGWSKESEHVEMAICEIKSGEVVEHGYDGETPRYIQLDRTGLNRLIRILRRARDDAFGRDE